ncbi:MAG: osmotically inducible protein OsmC [Bacteroidetes bacterium]|nr:osmotically inducible protein OsmC [Bacteroidota bacterium]
MKIEVNFEGKRGVNALINGYVIKTDQAVADGGDGLAPTPFDLFLASLGTCAGAYIKSFCDQRGLSTENIKLFQEMEYDQTTHLFKKINIEIQVPKDFPEKYHEALVTVAGKCKVKRHLLNPPEINVSTKVI